MALPIHARAGRHTTRSPNIVRQEDMDMAHNKTSQRIAKHNAYNRGYLDGINGRPADHTGTPPELIYFYDLGHAEGTPKRRVPTYIPSHNGPVRIMASLEQAAFMLSSNYKMPGGRR